ncbi:MAG TPA: DUF1361 domain-containing protein [Chitinophagaceae bacterium]|jgi:uncharacterized membrane protein
MKNIFHSIEDKFFQRSTIRQWMWVSCSFSMVLLVLRIITSGRLSYGFLAWNLFLAFVPYFISSWLSNHAEMLKSRLRLSALIFLWMLFMPNSFYILTDLFHLQNLDNGHPWFDLLLIFSFAWNGILFGILSIQKMEMILKNGKGKLVSGFVIAVVMWLNAFGVYIGRMLHFNSWDIFTNPFDLISDIANMFLAPYYYRYVWVMSLCFAFFMIIIYYTIKKSAEFFAGIRN